MCGVCANVSTMQDFHVEASKELREVYDAFSYQKLMQLIYCTVDIMLPSDRRENL